MIVTRDDVPGAVDGEPLLYRVVAICDEPTITIEPLYERDGEDREIYAVSSPAFGEFREVRSGIQAGRFDLHYPFEP